MSKKRKSEPKKSGKSKSSHHQRRFQAGNLFIVLGFVFFLAITISSLLVFQRSDKGGDDPHKLVEQTLEQTEEQAKIKALEAAPANKPHPINLGNISIDDTVIDDGASSETVKLPPNVTISIPEKTIKIPPRTVTEDVVEKGEGYIESQNDLTQEREGEVASLPPVNNNSLAKQSWKRPERPMIAIVLDDVGVNRKGAELAIELPGVVTLSFMTYAPDVQVMTKAAREKGHELMLHVPMEPLGRADPGPQALLTGLSDQEILSRFEWGMAQFDGYIGINNHMGSKFTGWDRGMKVVMQRIEKTDHFFMDSRTSPNSVAAETAASLGVPVLRRDTFLDNDYQDPDKIEAQLKLTERIALKNGHAIAIGHPHKTTIRVLHQWIKSAENRGFNVVSISEILALKKLAE